MKKIFMIMMAAALSLPLSAKSMKDIWLSIPDSIVPYLDKNKRIELADFIDMKVKSEVQNLLGENSVMDTITANYLSLKLNESSLLQMKLLPVAGDTIICMVRTYSAPASESNLEFYSKNWVRLHNYDINLSQYGQTMIVKPDTMSVEHFEKLKSNIDFQLIKASLSKDTNDLTLEMNIPLPFKDEKSQVSPIFMQRKFKWNGKSFN